jgi:hypothetical protein
LILCDIVGFSNKSDRLINRLKNVPRPKGFVVCILGDQQHCDEANANNIPCMDAEALKKLNKNKKLVKKLGEFLWRKKEWRLI